MKKSSGRQSRGKGKGKREERSETGEALTIAMVNSSTIVAFDGKRRSARDDFRGAKTDHLINGSNEKFYNSTEYTRYIRYVYIVYIVYM